MASFQWKDLNKSLIASKEAKYYNVFEEMTCPFISKFDLLYFAFHLNFTNFFLKIVLLPELFISLDSSSRLLRDNIISTQSSFYR